MFLAIVGVPLLCLAAAVIYQIFKKPPEEVSDGVCTALRCNISELANLTVHGMRWAMSGGHVPLKVMWDARFVCSPAARTHRALSETLRPVLSLSPPTAVNLRETRRQALDCCHHSMLYSMLYRPTHCEPRSIVSVVSI